jgi:hypothetical protein
VAITMVADQIRNACGHCHPDFQWKAANAIASKPPKEDNRLSKWLSAKF